MLRSLALLLLLANALLLAALAGLFDGVGGTKEREPERLQRQHQPGLVTILGPQAASAALVAASAQAAAASGADAALACMEAGPFSAADAATAERTLREAGLAAGAWQVQRSDDSGAFMVYMGRYADRETLQRKLAELKRLKLDGEDLRSPPELQPGISLGRFDSQDSANAAMAQMAQRGLRTARVIVLRQAQSRTVLRVPAADALLRARLAGLQLPSGPGFLPCAAPAAAPAASAATPAASAAAPAASPPGTAVLAPAARAAASAAAVAKPGAAPKAVPVAPPAPAAAVERSPAAAPAPARTASSPLAVASTRAVLARAANAAAPEPRVSASR
jgi:hypothetical protein